MKIIITFSLSSSQTWSDLDNRMEISMQPTWDLQIVEARSPRYYEDGCNDDIGPTMECSPFAQKQWSTVVKRKELLVDPCEITFKSESIWLVTIQKHSCWSIIISSIFGRSHLKTGEFLSQKPTVQNVRYWSLNLCNDIWSGRVFVSQSQSQNIPVDPSINSYWSIQINLIQPNAYLFI